LNGFTSPFVSETSRYACCKGPFKGDRLCSRRFFTDWHEKTFQTFIDLEAETFETLIASSGKISFQIEMRTGDLLYAARDNGIKLFPFYYSFKEINFCFIRTMKHSPFFQPPLKTSFSKNKK